MSLKYKIKNNEISKLLYFNPTKNIEHMKLILHDHIDVYPKDDDVDPLHSYEEITTYINRLTEYSGFLCRGLNSNYVSESLDRADVVVIITSNLINILPNGSVFGFATIIFDEVQNLIYIDVICSHYGTKNVGSILIHTIEDIGKKLLMERIKLTSVKSAISFYQQFGFHKLVDTCDTMCDMVKYINHKKISPKSGKKGGKTSKRKQTLKYRNSIKRIKQ